MIRRRLLPFTIGLIVAIGTFMMTTSIGATEAPPQTASQWQSPPPEVLEVLHAQQFPQVWTAPNGEHLLLADRILYPALAELAAPMYKLAGLRVNPVTNSWHGQHGGVNLRLVRVADGTTRPLALPSDAEVNSVRWTADGQRFALIVKHADHLGLWLGAVNGDLMEIDELALNSLLGNPVSWLPDQQRLLLRRIPQRGAAPAAPVIPVGPDILEGVGATARSTYEARNLLETAHDDALFKYYATAELVILDPATRQIEVSGRSATASTTAAEVSESRARAPR